MDKKINKTGKLLLCMVALTAWLFSACDDTMGGSTTTAPEFPADTLVEVVNPGDTVEIPFNAAVNWKLSSNKGWCMTMDSTMNISGKSGKQVVPFLISDEAHGFTDDRAEITLWMNNKSRVIACITRRAKGYSMELSKLNGDSVAAGESIVLGTSGSMKLNVNTNFGLDQLRWNCPSWLEYTRDGKTITLEVVRDSMRYIINNPFDSLVIFNSDSVFSQSFHVQYVGMDSRKISVSSSVKGTLVVSRDAKKCHVVGDEDENEVYPTFTVEALNNGYELVSVAYDEDNGCSVLTDEECWFMVEDDHCGNIGLSFTEENNGDERKAYLFALPHVIADSLDTCADGYETAVIDFLWEKTDDGVVYLKDDAQMFCIVGMVQERALSWVVTISPETRWNLRVSTDGKTYSDAIKGDTCNAPVKALVTSEDGYELVCASYSSQVGYTIVDMEDSWISISYDEKDSLEVRFEANAGNERSLYLLALPTALVESLDPESSEYRANLSAALFEEVDGLFEIKARAEQYLIAKFTQEADEANSVKVLRQGINSIEVSKETDQTWLDAALEKGVAPDRVFTCSMDLDYAYLINPLIALLPEEVLSPVEVYGKSGKKYLSGTNADYIEEHTKMEEMEGDYMLVQLTANEHKVDGKWQYYIQEDFIIYFKDSDGNYLKALVVTLL